MDSPGAPASAGGSFHSAHFPGDYCSEVRHCVSRWRDVMDPGRPDTVRAPTLGQLVGTLEREDEYISRRAEARGRGPECVVGMVRAGQPAKARGRGRGDHEDSEGVGCELDVQSSQRWSGEGIPAGSSSRGRDMEGTKPSWFIGQRDWPT